MAGRIPEEFVAEIKRRAGIVDVVTHIGGVELKSKGENHVGKSPFVDEKTASFVVNSKKNIASCFSTGKHGMDSIKFLQTLKGYEFPDAIAELANYYGLEVPRNDLTSEQKKVLGERGLILSALNDAQDYYYQNLSNSQINAVAVKCLTDRGINGEIAKQFGMGYAPSRANDGLYQALKSKYSLDVLVKASLVNKPKAGGKIYDFMQDRITLPIKSQRGEIIAFGGRIINPNADFPKYINSRDSGVFKKGSELFNQHQASASIRSMDACYVVEGYMDTVALSQFGIDNSVGALGTAFTVHHLNTLSKKTDNLTFVFDGDRAGRQAAWKSMLTCLPKLDDGVKLGFVFNPEGEDPDSMVRKEGEDAYRARLNAALPLSSYVVEELTLRHPENTPESLARRAKECSEVLNQMPRGVYQELLINNLSENLNVPSSTLRELMPLKSAKPAVPAKSAQSSVTPKQAATRAVTPPPQQDKHFTGAGVSSAIITPTALKTLSYESFCRKHEDALNLLETTGNIEQVCRAIIPGEIRASECRVNIRHLTDNISHAISESSIKCNMKETEKRVFTWAGKVLDEQISALNKQAAATRQEAPTQRKPSSNHSHGLPNA